MKILLLTDIPPCKDFTAGLVLDQLCRFLPRGSIACFALVNPALDAKLSPDLRWIPVAYGKKRVEAALRPLPGQLSFPIAWLIEKLRRQFVVPRLAEQVVEFARAQKTDLLWAVLQGQSIIQIAPAVARRLNIPLVTQVWDPPAWWLLDNRIDPFNRRAALSDLDCALRDSRTCMTASWAMAQVYEARYGTRSIPVMCSHPSEWASTPDLGRFPRDEIEIGMAGQFYAGSEWLQLLQALSMNDWRVRGRPVRLTVLGAKPPPGDAPRDRLQYVGWRSQRQAIELLSKMDLAYCPYPFAQPMKEIAELSFPSKLVLYLAAGRPVLFHGPETASPAAYIRKFHAGDIVPDQDAGAVYNTLCQLVDNPALYVELGQNAQKAFQRDFTLTTMRRNFAAALDLPLDQIPELVAEPAAPTHLPDVTALIRGSGGILARTKSTAHRLRRIYRSASSRLTSSRPKVP